MGGLTNILSSPETSEQPMGVITTSVTTMENLFLPDNTRTEIAQPSGTTEQPLPPDMTTIEQTPTSTEQSMKIRIKL